MRPNSSTSMPQSRAVASIIIPAHNESAVISRCLKSILSGSIPGEFQIIVVSNGCTDSTADIVRKDFPLVTLIDTPKASKTWALNMGDEVASIFPRIYLDADLVVTPESLRALIQPLQSEEVLAACGQMNISTSLSSFAVRSFYRIWRYNSYLKTGKFGGLFAVTKKGHSQISPFPDVTNDDEYVRRSFTDQERAYVENCHFEMTSPRSLSGLLKIRTRAIRGTKELVRIGYPDEKPQSRNLYELLAHIIKQPTLWVDALFYILISLFIQLKVSFVGIQSDQVWERDDSSRGSA